MNVACTPTGAARLRVRIENDGDATVHLLDSPRMPYFIRDETGLLVLFGVNPPDPEVDYYGIEIPTTRPLEAGAAIEHDVSLDPLYLRDHYETEREPTPLARPLTVRCEVGYGDTPILESERHLYSIESVIAWQKLACSPPVTLG